MLERVGRSREQKEASPRPQSFKRFESLAKSGDPSNYERHSQSCLGFSRASDSGFLPDNLALHKVLF